MAPTFPNNAAGDSERERLLKEVGEARELLQRVMDALPAGSCSCSQVAQLSDHAARLRALEAVREEDTQGWRSGMTRIEDKLDRLNYWLMGALLTSCLSLVGLVITLLRK